MENANMSQNAEQTAIGNVLPSGQDGNKRQVSADNFRALTLRLNSKITPAAIPPIEPEPDLQPVFEVVAEPTTGPVAATELVIETVPHPTQPHPTQPLDTEPSVSDFAENNIVAPDPLEFVEPVSAQQVEQIAPAIAAPSPFLAPPLAPAAAPSPPLAPAPAEPEAFEAPTQFAMPVSGTQIILNAAAKPKARVQNVSAAPVAISEAIQPGEIVELPPEILSADPVREPVPVTIDPLQAAMNLMNATGVSSKVDDAATPALSAASIEHVVPVTQIPLNDTVEKALSRDFNTPKRTEPVGKFESPSQNSEPATVAVEIPVQTTQPVQTSEIVERPRKQAPPIVGDANECPPELEPDAQSGETARALLDIMSSGSQPQERALAADTLLQLVPRMMVRDLVALAERVCMMEDAPSLLVKALINHREAKVAGPLLEDGKVVVEQDLLRLIATTGVDRLIMMAKHRIVTQTVCDALIARGEPSVYLTLVRNPGAALSHDAFVAFNEIAKSQSSLQAPLATRGDTPPPIAFELFWSLPVELRRYVLSRFLTDSATLDKILKITQSVDGGSSGEQRFPPTRKVEELVDLIADGLNDQAANKLAELAGTNQENARRIIADPDGEPLTVVLKTMGQTRAQFNQAITKCASSSKTMLRSDRDLVELQIMFDSLSFNKARTLLTYWDWAVEKTGPYSRRVM